ncbi:tyrosine-type recombinase/integrase [Acinetobacter sp. MD2(2019)]|uniref:tyrosine-type recombinase/integrase n=1 Tax=Acinetobacter sp. MD2(2019) TaxID=2605273 RepID=UPI002D1F81A3|nr:tyrosine-type recombinase/integrase [Acinetobacter sp. MD2(2019)]MEB3753801.1 tyrosine-type recombinase/integrase [Acinetobacter sp. MD2(2019)]
MGTIAERITTDGKTRYRAQIRITRKGLPPFIKTRTFAKESLAKEWIKRLEAEILINPAILNPEAVAVSKTLKEFFERYLAEIGDEFGGTKPSALKHIYNYSLAHKNVYDITRQDFSNFAIERRKGNPIEMTDGVAPATVLKDLSHIASVLNHAELVWGEDILFVKNELTQALIGLKKARIVTKSKARDRLATHEELQILTNHFYKGWKRVRNAIPMHLVMWLAIYTGRREGELCSMRLDDFDRKNSQWKIRDVKNPDGSKGNHKYAHLEPLALQVIDELLDPQIRARMLELGYSDELLLPVNVQTVSDYFRRGCRLNGIEDLRFHDLRHEAATRYAEDGFSIPQLQTITLHSSWSSLQRYVNLKKRGERLDFPSAMQFARKQYDENYSKFALKQRYVSAADIADAEQAYTQIETPDVINTELDFIKASLMKFMKSFRPTKSVKDMYKEKSNIQNIFAWNDVQQCFVVQYIQNAWENWFGEKGEIDWQQLPGDTTHFSIKGLDVLKIEGERVHKWEKEINKWFDITKYFDANTSGLIKK